MIVYRKSRITLQRNRQKYKGSTRVIVNLLWSQGRDSESRSRSRHALWHADFISILSNCESDEYVIHRGDPKQYYSLPIINRLLMYRFQIASTRGRSFCRFHPLIPNLFLRLRKRAALVFLDDSISTKYKLLSPRFLLRLEFRFDHGSPMVGQYVRMRNIIIFF